MIRPLLAGSASVSGRKRWFLVLFTVLCVLVAYYGHVAHGIVFENAADLRKYSGTGYSAVARTVKPPLGSGLEPLNDKVTQIHKESTMGRRGPQLPLQPLRGNFTASDVPCDESYIDSWYTLSDEKYCEKISTLVFERLRKGSTTSSFPAPNIGASDALASLIERQHDLHMRVASGKEPPGQRYLIWSLSGGVGNRVQALVSTFMAAMLSGRVLLMKDWFSKGSGKVSTAKRLHDLQLEDLDILFNSEWSKNEDLLCPALPMMSLRVFREKYPHYFTDAQYSLQHVKVDITAKHDHSNKRWNRILCKNLTQSFRQRFVYIWTNQYFLPILFANPVHSDQMKALFPPSDDGRVDAFGPLVRFLFLPHRVVMQRAHEFICRNFKGKRVLGLQVRAFRAGGMDTMASTFSTCANQVYKTETASDQLYFVASMHSEVRDKLIKIYGKERLLFLDEPRERQGTGDLTLDREAVADMFILMHTGDFLLSPGSTFGLLAAGYRSFLPVRVHRSQRYGVCSRMESSQPCFGSWLSYDFISQKAQAGNTYTCKVNPIPHELDNCLKT